MFTHLTELLSGHLMYIQFFFHLISFLDIILFNNNVVHAYEHVHIWIHVPMRGVKQIWAHFG